MSLGDRRRKPRAVIVLCLAAALVACLGTGSILAASRWPEYRPPLAKKKCAKKRGKARKKCQKHAAKPPAPTVTLTVASNLPGAGTIVSSPTGISCGTVCTAKFDPGTLVHLSATDASGYFQDDWTGGGCSGRGGCDLLLKSDTSVVAGFLERVTVTADAGAGGTVEVTAPGAPFGVCTDATTCTVNPGDDVAVTATPGGGYSFYEWSGDCSGTDPVFSFSSIAAPGRTCHAGFATSLSVNMGGDWLRLAHLVPGRHRLPGHLHGQLPGGNGGHDHGQPRGRGHLRRLARRLRRERRPVLHADHQRAHHASPGTSGRMTPGGRRTRARAACRGSPS